MSKKSWFVALLVIAVIVIMALSKLVAGFDPWVQNTILGPAWNGILGIGAAITGNPFYQAYQFQLGAATAFIISIVFALILWPKIRKSKTAEKATATLQDKLPSRPTQIPASPQPTAVAAAPVAPAPEAEAVEAEK